MPSTNVLTAEDRRAFHKAGFSSYAALKEVGAQFPAVNSVDEFLVPVASLTTTASTVYARYLGRATGAHSLNKLTTITSGTPSATVVSTVGFATSAAPANGTAQTLTPVAVTTIATTGSAGNKSNATNLNFFPPVGSYLWVIYHVSATGTQPTVWGLGGEVGQGFIQTKGSQVAAPVVGVAIATWAIPAAAVTAQAPLLIIS